jgi:hypothetical protein
LFIKNQKADLINGAEEQAKTLYNLNKIALGAELQAKELFIKNQKADLINGAEEQAKLLLESNNSNEIKESAQKEAERLNTLNNENMKISQVKSKSKWEIKKNILFIIDLEYIV